MIRPAQAHVNTLNDAFLGLFFTLAQRAEGFLPQFEAQVVQVGVATWPADDSAERVAEGAQRAQEALVAGAVQQLLLRGRQRTAAWRPFRGASRPADGPVPLDRTNDVLVDLRAAGIIAGEAQDARVLGFIL